MISLIDSSGFVDPVSNSIIWVIAISYLAGILTFYVLRSLGIYKLAKRQELKNCWLAFIPCAWMFLVCKIIGKVRFFFDSFSKLALLITIVFSVGEVLSLTSMFIRDFPLVAYFVQGGQINLLQTAEGFLVQTPQMNNSFDVLWVNQILKLIDVIGPILSLINTVIEVFAFIALFRKYVPKTYILFSILSVIGLFAPFVFAIRNKEAVDFNEYMRKRYYENMNRYYGQNPYGRNDGGQNQNPYQNPRQNGGYGANNSNGYNQNEQPFEEFGEKKSAEDDPFSEFEDKDK